jgi:hypothetical protein
MDKNEAISRLKDVVREDIKYLCLRADRHWSAPIVRTLRELRGCGGQAVFFGGAIRSLLFSRLATGKLGRPRDVDIVVNEITLDGLRRQFGAFVTRETRFGGLQLLRDCWYFDIWPLTKTWAFIADEFDSPSFDNLPQTTFFNLEAIAVEVWSSSSKTRIVYSGDDQFFEGVLTRTLELNRIENPFPSLCVVRSLALASGMDLSIGPKLAEFLVRHSPQVSDEELVRVQVKHYGKIRVYPDTARSWLNYIRENIETVSDSGLRLPLLRQSQFWPDPECSWPHLLSILGSARYGIGKSDSGGEDDDA